MRIPLMHRHGLCLTNVSSGCRGMNGLAVQVQQALLRDPHAGDRMYSAAAIQWSGPGQKTSAA